MELLRAKGFEDVSSSGTKGNYLYNRMVTHKESYEQALISWSNYTSPSSSIKLPYNLEAIINRSVEFDNHWYPTLKHLWEDKKGVCCYRVFLRKIKTMSLEEALYQEYDRLEQHRFWFEGYYGTTEEHCTRKGTSYSRVITRISKLGGSFEEAINCKPQNIIKHTINGEVKRNKAWFEYFGINPITANSYLSRHKCMEKTLRHFGVDTSSMHIAPYI